MPDEPTFAAHYGPLFSIQFENYTEDQQKKIFDFLKIYFQHGLDRDCYPGKLSPTWNIPGDDPDYLRKYEYAFRNQLWHYHIGLPEYKVSPSGRYMTSDWVLHFQRHDQFAITLVDSYTHYTSDGVFYIPDAPYLTNPVGSLKPSPEEDSEPEPA